MTCRLLYTRKARGFLGLIALEVNLVPIKIPDMVPPGKNILSRYLNRKTGFAQHRAEDTFIWQGPGDLSWKQISWMALLGPLSTRLYSIKGPNHTPRENSTSHSKTNDTHPNIFAKKLSMFDLADVMELSPSRVSLEILPDSHEYQALLLVVLHRSFAF